MKRFGRSITQALIAGALFLTPIYLMILLVLKAMKPLAKVVRPLVRLFPQSFPADRVISFVAVLLLCIVFGIVLRTTLGEAIRTRIENFLLKKIPGYEVIRNLTWQLAGKSQESAWQPALAEIENALVPAFIVEELEDGCFTVFVPSVPTPLAGAIYILTAERVHPLNIPFTQAVKAIARWGSGSKELVAAMPAQPKSSVLTKESLLL